jgi:hypothetical protein
MHNSLAMDTVVALSSEWSVESAQHFGGAVHLFHFYPAAQPQIISMVL